MASIASISRKSDPQSCTPLRWIERRPCHIHAELLWLANLEFH